MALTAVLIGVGVAGGIGASKVLTPKVKTPDAPPAPVAAPTPPAAPVIPAVEPPDNAAALAAKRTRRMNMGGGRSSTILTGPTGLGELGSSNSQTKTLLGY